MRALDRLVSVLDAVATPSRPVTASQVQIEVGLSLSTTARLLLELAETGLLDRDEPTGSYRIGHRFYSIARHAAQQMGAPMDSVPVMTRLRDLTGETGSLHVRESDQILCVASVPSRKVVRLEPLGRMSPIVGSATGHVLLAGASEALQKATIRNLALDKRAEATLRDRLSEARRAGYAVLADETFSGVCGISAPVRDGNEVVAAVTVSGPSDRFTPEIAAQFGQELIDAGLEIGAAIAANFFAGGSPFQPFRQAPEEQSPKNGASPESPGEVDPVTPRPD